MTVNRADILDKFQLFRGGTGGLDSWLSDVTPDAVFETLADLENNPLTRSRLNQLLTLSHEAPIDGCVLPLLLVNGTKAASL